MNRIRAATLIALCATACQSAETHAASSHPARTVQPQGAILYQATFTHNGLQGWVTRRWSEEGWVPDFSGNAPSRSDWTVNRRGIVTFRGGSPGDDRASNLFAPYRITGMRDYAIQATIKLGRPSKDPFESGYGLVIGDAGRRPHVLLGGFLGMSVSAGPDAGLAWHGDEVVGAGTSSLHPGYNTYRLEVHNTDYTLSINGRQAVQFTIADFANGTTVGLWDFYQTLQISSFTVTRLQAVAPLPPLPPVQALALSPADLGADRADVPSSLSSLPGQYFTREGASRDRQFPMARLASEGFLIGYERDYFCCTGNGDPSKATGPYGVSGIVDAFSSPQGAQQALADDWAVEQQHLSRQTNYTNYTAGDITGLGDQAHERSADFNNPYVGKIAGAEVIFRRGTYVVTVDTDSLPQTLSRAELATQTAALARIVDGHILQQEAHA